MKLNYVNVVEIELCEAANTSDRHSHNQTSGLTRPRIRQIHVRSVRFEQILAETNMLFQSVIITIRFLHCNHKASQNFYVSNVLRGRNSP